VSQLSSGVPPLIQHETALSTCLRPYPALGSYGIIPPCDAGKVIQLYGPEGKVARHDPSSHP